MRREASGASSPSRALVVLERELDSLDPNPVFSLRAGFGGLAARADHAATRDLRPVTLVAVRCPERDFSRSAAALIEKYTFPVPRPRTIDVCV